MQKVVLGMALKVAQLDSFRVRSHNASANQQGAVNPRLGFANVVPLPTLRASALLVYVNNTRRAASSLSIARTQSLNSIRVLRYPVEHIISKKHLLSEGE